MITLTVKDNRIGPVLGRHPWVYSQALVNVPDGIPSGEPVRLVSERGMFLATGYFNSYSQIAVRLWGFTDNEPVDKDFFLGRIRKALAMRIRLVASDQTNAYRLVHGENDLLPGLVVDRYGDWLALQCHTRGIERWKDTIVEALIEALKPNGIYERSEAAARHIERLDVQSGLLYGEVPELVGIIENGLRFLVDISGGQKTGFFLDQRDKRAAARKYALVQNVLNAFSYTGGFTVAALAGGAERVTSVDVSAGAMEIARENIKLNGFSADRCAFIEADVKDYLRTVKHGEFGFIILDPPAFIKDRRKKPAGLAGYKGINEAAMRVLPEAGVLMTCSCSAHLSAQEFRYLLSEAGGHIRRTLRITEAFGHGADHPSLAPFIEGDYLKCIVMEVD